MSDIEELIKLEPYKSCYEYGELIGYQQGRADAIEEYKTALKSKIERECKYLSDGGCTTTEYLDPYYIDNVAERLKEQK